MKDNLKSLIKVLRALVGLGLLAYFSVVLFFFFSSSSANLNHTSLNEFVFILYCPFIMVVSIFLSFRSFKWAGILLSSHAIIYLISSAIEAEAIFFIGIPTLALGVLFFWYSRLEGQ